MVLRHRDPKMASGQPVKKKLKRDDEAEAATEDETDFICKSESRVQPDLSALHMYLPANVNEQDLRKNEVNNLQAEYRTTSSEKINENSSDSRAVNGENSIPPDILPFSFVNSSFVANLPVISSICTEGSSQSNHDRNAYKTNHLVKSQTLSSNFVSVVTVSRSNRENDNIRILNNGLSEEDRDLVLDDFQKHLIKHCLCGISKGMLRKPFESQQITDCNGKIRTAMLTEWPIDKVLQFLSNLQLLFDVYLKQNNKGFICSRIAQVCDAIVRNEYNLIEQLISLRDTCNRYVSYLSARVLSSFLIVTKTNVNNEWLETILFSFVVDAIDYNKMNFALEIIKRVVEWRDVEIHILDESQDHDSEAGPSNQNSNCTTISYNDSESYDTSSIKGLLIKSLESKWPDLINKIQHLITNNNCIRSQTCILTFLALWESTISVKANLSVIDTKPFYAHLEIFVSLLNNTLPPIIWKQLLSLFNEVLCYGSTLALQDMLPDDTCQLAHLIVRYVKDYRLLDSLPFRRAEGYTVNSFAGTILTTQFSSPQPTTTTDKTLLQKMVLLVLKSVAITIKETRSDSSDSSVGSDDYDFYQDMQLIERSIRDVLKKVDTFIKNALEFHPETPFSKVMIHLFSDQDDYMIESMVCTLDITIGISYRNAVFPDLISMLNPTYSFIEFLKVVSHDSDVLLDYLVSNETCFLLYLLRFLKYIRRNWSKFVNSCSEAGLRTNELENTMTVLIRLKLQINRLVTKDLFPYNITPVIRLLDACENLYEGNEFS